MGAVFLLPFFAGAVAILRRFSQRFDTIAAGIVFSVSGPIILHVIVYAWIFR
jgi:hypothetical protein